MCEGFNGQNCNLTGKLSNVQLLCREGGALAINIQLLFYVISCDNQQSLILFCLADFKLTTSL